MASIYDFKVKNIKGEEVDLSIYKGSVAVIVNTASKCGFTPQYEGLEDLYEKYKDKKVVVLGFPCNQFGAQEPEGEEQIAQFCETKFNIKFPMFAKIEVNGPNAHPLYNFLKKECKGLLGTEQVKWNFTKFLVDQNGKPIDRFAPTTKPEELVEHIEKLLK